MVLDAFVALVVVALDGVLLLLPRWSFNINVDYVYKFMHTYTQADAILPVHETGVIIAFFFARFLYLNAFKGGKSLISLFTGGGGAS